jgi:hypothetical protein
MQNAKCKMQNAKWVKRKSESKAKSERRKMEKNLSERLENCPEWVKIRSSNLH